MSTIISYASMNALEFVENLTGFRNEIDALYGEVYSDSAELVVESAGYQQFITRLHETQSKIRLDFIYAALNWSPHLRDHRFEIMRDYICLDTTSLFTNPMTMRIFQRIFSLKPDIVGITSKERGTEKLYSLHVQDELDLLNCFDIQYTDLKEFISLYPGVRSVVLPFQTLFADPSKSIGQKIVQFSKDNPTIKKLTLSGLTTLNEFCIGKMIQIPELLTREKIPAPNEFQTEIWEHKYPVDAQIFSQSCIALTSIRSASFNFSISEGDTWLSKECDSYIKAPGNFPDFLVNNHTGITSMVFNRYNERSDASISGSTLCAVILKNQRTLQTIDLSLNDFEGDNINVLNALAKCKSLTRLMLGASFESSYKVDNRQALVNSLVGVVEKCTKLETLDLSSWDCLPETAFNELINHGKSLISLNLESNSISFEIVNLLAAGLPNLRWINCSNDRQYTNEEKTQLERDYPQITFIWKS